MGKGLIVAKIHSKLGGGGPFFKKIHDDRLLAKAREKFFWTRVGVNLVIIDPISSTFIGISEEDRVQ
jgi:hypothetical protein